MNKPTELQNEVRKFFDILDIVEESDNGNEFHPVFISCCRAITAPKLNEILQRMKELM